MRLRNDVTKEGIAAALLLVLEKISRLPPSQRDHLIESLSELMYGTDLVSALASLEDDDLLQISRDGLILVLGRVNPVVGGIAAGAAVTLDIATTQAALEAEAALLNVLQAAQLVREAESLEVQANTACPGIMAPIFFGLNPVETIAQTTKETFEAVKNSSKALAPRVVKLVEAWAGLPPFESNLHANQSRSMAVRRMGTPRAFTRAAATFATPGYIASRLRLAFGTSHNHDVSEPLSNRSNSNALFDVPDTGSAQRMLYTMTSSQQPVSVEQETEDVIRETISLDGLFASAIEEVSLAIELLAKAALDLNSLDRPEFATCTARAMNRIVPVNLDGSFRITGIPTSNGLFKVRGECASGLSVYRGTSDFFAMTPNGTVDVGVLDFVTVHVSPIKARVVASKATLTSPGDTANLTVTGILRDNSTVDVTASARGTAYIASNPAACTVGNEGLVTSISSGVCVVTAINEGVVATIPITIVVDDDRDGDGIPDDFEDANRLHPGGSNLANSGVVTASSFSQMPSRAIDGNLLTSWFTASGDAGNNGQSPFIEITLPQSSNISQVRLIGNRQTPGTSVFLAGIFTAFDGSGNKIFDSGVVRFFLWPHDAAVPVNLTGVRRVRFTGTSDQTSTPGLAEIQLIGASGDPGLDPNNPADAAQDFDGDGLTNFQEFQGGTNIFLSDTDGDGLTDSQETAIGSNNLFGDTDSDGLLDGLELSPTSDSDGDGKRNILDSDSDNDELPDGVEVRIGRNPLNSGDALIDTDRDGILDLDEYLSNLDPLHPDTDDDGISDGEEVVAGIDGYITDPRKGDTDGDVFLDGLEVDGRSDPTDANSIPLLSFETFSTAISVANTKLPSSEHWLVSPAFSIANTLLVPETQQTLVSAAVSVANTVLTSATSQELIGSAISIRNVNPSNLPLSLQTVAMQPLAVSLDEPRDGDTLLEGQTITVRASFRGNQVGASVRFVVNGQVLSADSTFPYELTFTVPAGVNDLTFVATANDALGNEAATAAVRLKVQPDPFTTISGRVVDAAGNPIAGVVVDLLSEGLQAEFFKSLQPLTTLPDVTAQTPDHVTRITALNLRNPNGVFGFDPLGSHLAPDYAVRFTGSLNVTMAGAHRFFLGAHEGARLTIAGVTVVDISTGTGEFQEGSGEITLVPGVVPIEVTYYEGVGNAELQLSWTQPGGERQVVPPSSLGPGRQPFITTTDASGAFTLHGVPTTLDAVQVRATMTENNQNISGLSSRVAPVPPNGIDIGNIVIRAP
jgi:hypothetical protein